MTQALRHRTAKRSTNLALADAAIGDLRQLERKAIAWLTNEGQAMSGAGDVWHGLCNLLACEGMALTNGVLQIRALHPKFARVFHLWLPGRPWEVWYESHDGGSLISHETVFGGVSGESEQRAQNLMAPSIPAETFLSDNTRYDQILVPLEFTDTSRNTGQWTSNRDTGFIPQEADLFRHIAPILSTILELKMLRRRSASVLAAYVGEEPARQILEGRIQRGDVTRIKAAMMLCDLRGFTEMATTVPSETLVANLNSYFDAVFPHIAASGGEVLKFMGDGILAVFRHNTDGLSRETVCRRALDCALKIAGHAQSTSANGEPNMRVSLALHYGEVAFGNIGSGGRLDFTVIGSDVNLVSRIEPICKKLDESILLSAAIAERLAAHVRLIGQFDLKGFDQPQSIFQPSRTEASRSGREIA